MSEKNREPLDEKECAELNDETTWERRKFQELLHDPCEQLDPIERINRRIKREKMLRKENARREKISKDMQWVRLKLFHANDIQRLDFAEQRISILDKPQYFPAMKELKQQLKQVTVWASFRVTIRKSEIAIRLGSLLRSHEHNYIDYFVLINKNPGKTPNNLLFKADWGQWDEIGNYRKTRTRIK
jgi:hypothetical protein